MFVYFTNYDLVCNTFYTEIDRSLWHISYTYEMQIVIHKYYATESDIGLF